MASRPSSWYNIVSSLWKINMIIIEGMDNTGKTTLIQQLQKEFKLPTARTGTYPRSLEDIIQWHNWANACPKQPIVDRHPAISDLVYGPIIRDHTYSTQDEAFSARRHHFLVFCCPPLLTIRSTYADREQMAGTHDNLDRLYYAYQDLMMNLEPDFIYDFTNPRAFSALIAQLQPALRRME